MKRKRIDLQDRVDFKTGGIPGIVVEIIDKDTVTVLDEKAEYGQYSVLSSKLKKLKTKCDLCHRKTFVRVYINHDTGSNVVYVCNSCCKKSPDIMRWIEFLNGKDFSPRGIIKQAEVLSGRSNKC